MGIRWKYGQVQQCCFLPRSLPDQASQSRLPCAPQHVFHVDCVMPWLRKAGGSTPTTTTTTNLNETRTLIYLVTDTSFVLASLSYFAGWLGCCSRFEVFSGFIRSNRIIAGSCKQHFAEIAIDALPVIEVGLLTRADFCKQPQQQARRKKEPEHQAPRLNQHHVNLAAGEFAATSKPQLCGQASLCPTCRKDLRPLLSHHRVVSRQSQHSSRHALFGQCCWTCSPLMNCFDCYYWI